MATQRVAVPVDSPALETVAADPSVSAPDQVHYYPRSGYVWPYAEGPFYGKVEERRRGKGMLVTPVGTFRLDAGPLSFPDELYAKGGWDTARGSVPTLDKEAARYFLVQFDPDSLSKDLWDRVYDKIRDGGGDVIRHMPVAVILARLTAQAHAALQETRGLLAIEPYHPALKLDPAIGRTPLLDPRKALSDVYTLDISLHRSEDPTEVAEHVVRMGGNVLQIWTDRIQADLPSGRLAELANLEAVYRVHEKIPIVPWDQKITNAVQTGSINSNANPYHDAGIRGEGQVLMVLDNGIQMDAGDLSDTSTSAGTAGLSHRKVRFYGTTAPFGGSGDADGCDAQEQGGFTHGHLVSAIALGNPEHDDLTFRVSDANDAPWDLTGVAPDAKLAAYDANVTPVVGACQDTLLGVLDVGVLYDPSPTAEGSLDDAYQSYGARTFNFSWGSNNNSYTADADDVDEFLNDHKDAMVFVAVGNLGQDRDYDYIADLGSIGEPATAKNALAIGSHGGPDDFGDPANINERSYFSGVGPAGATGRFAPLLMAPGQERGATGKPTAFSCRSGDNDSVGAVVCDSVSSKAGTSYASAAASGTGMLVRDYFAQGFHPDGTSANPGNDTDRVPNISGALVKSTLIASAEFLGLDFRGVSPLGVDNLWIRSRANNEQGYGRIQLDNALPLQNWPKSATGLLVVDGGIPGGVNDFAGSELAGSIDATVATTQTATFELCDDSQELRVALSWIEEPGDGLVNDLDLELVAPDETLYYGNFFTDDDNGDYIIDPLNEDCPSRFDDGTPQDNGLDRSAWSLAVCSRAGDGIDPGGLPAQDAINATAGIFLSPNPEGNLDEEGMPVLRSGSCDDAAGEACGYDAQCGGVPCLDGTSQVQAGTWTVRVKTKGGGSNDAQGYALVIAGGVCSGSSVSLDRTIYTCDDDVTLTINERDEASDPAGGLDAGVVAARARVEVLDADGEVRDLENGSDLGLALQAPGLRFSGSLSTTDGTAYDPGNGVLDVRQGDTLRLIYADESAGSDGGDPDKLRIATAVIDCRLEIVSSSIRFAQFGTNTSFLVTGGCERNARGLFEFGFPDRYMDAGESLAYRIAWASAETEPLENTSVELSCVYADADSPAECRPGSADCPDPDRENNHACFDLVILDPVQHVGRVDAASAISSNFQIQMMPVIDGTPEVEMLLNISGTQSGKTTRTLVVNRHRLNVDEATVRYSTDFPHGGTLVWDRNNNGLIENPVTTGITGFPASNNTDYVFETVQYSDLTQGIDAEGNPVVINDGIQAPWNFDTNDGGFTSGIAAGTDDALIQETIAQWGEDKNFNNRLDGRCRSAAFQACDRFPLDPLNCGFCDAFSGVLSGTACQTQADCGTGDCDFECINLEDRDPENFPVALLDQNWSTRGGCGWQTRAPGTCTLAKTTGCYNDGDCGTTGGTCDTNSPQVTGGIWHTGRIGDDGELDCQNTSDPTITCQLYETIRGVSGQLTWFELLVTPELTKVNQALDESGRPLATAEITEWRWNQAIDLADRNASYTVEFDHDVESLEPVDLKSDFTVLITGTGDYGAINGGWNPYLTRGWSMFAPLDPVTGMTRNGTVGNNRAGKNSCYFEGGAVPVANLEFLGLPGPPDDDVNEGYCPSGSGLTGTDRHLKYCTTVCSENAVLPCGADAACVGTCIGDPHGFCSNAPQVGCRPTCVGGDNSGWNCASDIDCQRCVGGFNDGTHCTSTADCTDGQDDGFCGAPGACPENGDAHCNFGTCVDAACNGTCDDGTCSNGKPGTCADDSDCDEACVFTSAAIDEFVQPNGPVRNHELNDWNGPDMRFVTLGDLFGVAGNRFAGAIGFQVREARYSPEAVSGYGLGIDDVVVEWREFTLEEDQTDCDPHCVGGAADGLPCSTDADCASGGGVCGGGSCATINLSSNNIYEGDTLLGVTVTDPSPSDNDCDGDEITDGTRDCDGNGVPDVVVRFDSPRDGASNDVERVILNAIPGSATAFSGSLPVSTRFDLPGTLFISPVFVSSTYGDTTDFDTSIRATYRDLDDGTGQPCGNSVDAESWGLVEAVANVLITPAPVVVTRSWIVADNGDDDGWADPGETVTLAVEVSNKSEFRFPVSYYFRTTLGFDASDVTLQLMSDDPAVACITRPTIALGDLAAGETRTAEETFEFIVDPGVQRAHVFEDLTATFRIGIQANEFQVAQQPQTITLDLDLDATGGGGPTTFFEGFEGGFGSFTTMHLDETLNPPDSDLANREAGVINADGWRCQYSDPDWEESASYGNSQGQQCFPNPNGAPDAYYFHLVTDRAFSGSASLGYNIFLDEARGYTTPNSQIDAVRTIDPVNLNWARVCSSSRTVGCVEDLDCPSGETCDSVSPLLSFKQQISLLDHRTVGAQHGRGADQAVVSVQVAGNDGEGLGPWVKAYPFVNVYDSMANSNYFNCSFDPADDGNTEEDFFDPTDPRRYRGPSSTCAPEFSFVHQGDTDAPPSPENLGDALDGPGLEGEHGIGTWVEPVFDLQRYRGRRLRLRFLETGLKLGGAVNWEQAFNFNPDPGDDGWFIDDVTITDALVTPATLMPDENDNGSLPTCDARYCGESGGVDVVVTVEPPEGTEAPGQVFELDASPSTVDVCKSGILQFRFWVEVDGDSAFDPGADLLLRDWTVNPRLSDLPQSTTRYAVSARCATETGCDDTEIVTALVNCPTSGNLTDGLSSIQVDAAPAAGDREVSLQWSPGPLGDIITVDHLTVDIVRGDLGALAGGGSVGTEVCVVDDFLPVTPEFAQSATDAPTPNHGDGWYWIIRSAAPGRVSEACNVSTTGGSYGGVGEAYDRTIDACPD